jgi:hypothetical protein
MQVVRVIIAVVLSAGDLPLLPAHDKIN